MHPSFMKWGIGEALFNNEINSSWGTLECLVVEAAFSACKNPSLLHPLLLILLFFITFMKSKQCVIETDFYYLERSHGEYSENALCTLHRVEIQLLRCSVGLLNIF